MTTNMTERRYELVKIDGTWRYGPAADGTYTYSEVKAEAYRRNGAERKPELLTRAQQIASARRGGTVLPGTDADRIFGAYEHYNDEPPTD